MKRSILTLALFVGTTLLAGCAHWPRSGINGAFYTDTKSPISVVVSEQAEPMKVGKACATGVLGLFGSGDSSISTAKKLGGITKVANVEEEFHQVFLGFYTRYCVVVSGW